MKGRLMATRRNPMTRGLTSYLPLIRQRAWLLLVCMLIGAVGAFLVSRSQPRIYSATAQLVVYQQTAGTSSYDAMLASEQLVQSYTAMIGQPVVLQRAASQLGDTSAAALASEVQISAPSGLNIIEIQVNDPSPIRAATFANAVAHAFIALEEETQQAQWDKARQTVEQQIAQVSSQIAAINQQLALAAVPTSAASQNTDADTHTLQQQLDAAQTRLSGLQSVDTQLTTSSLVAENSIRVFQPALPPETPTYPKTFLNVGIAAALGLVLAMGILLLLAYLDDHIRTAQDVEELTHLPVLATVPAYQDHKRGVKKKQPGFLATGHVRRSGQPEPQDLVIGEQGCIEHFLALCSYLTFHRSEKHIRTILVTSPTPGDGKTFAAINLAVGLAQSGKHVTLIDGNLRSPAINVRLSQSPLQTDTRVVQGIPITALSAASNRLVLKASSIACSPVELLNPGHFQRVVKSTLAGMAGIPPADFVIVDSPALLAVADASMLAAQVDATLIVVRAGRSRATQLTTAIEALSRINAHILGVVVDWVSPTTRGAGSSAGYSTEPAENTSAKQYDVYLGTQKARSVQRITAIEALNRINARLRRIVRGRDNAWISAVAPNQAGPTNGAGSDAGPTVNPDENGNTLLHEPYPALSGKGDDLGAAEAGSRQP